MEEDYIQIKVFNKTATTRKEVLRWDLLLSDISFTANINGWQWELVLEINKPITDTSYEYGDIIQVNKYWHQAQRTYWPNNLTWDEIEESRESIGNYTTRDTLVTEISPTIYTGYVSKIWIRQTGETESIRLTLLWMASHLTEKASD